MAGVGLLSNILADLPLPSSQLTPLETKVIGEGKMDNDTVTLLNNGDASVCSDIKKALGLVDTGFLKLKVAPQKRSFRPDNTTPLLIKNLLKSTPSFSRLQLNIKKIDTTGMVMPPRLSSAIKTDQPMGGAGQDNVPLTHNQPSAPKRTDRGSGLPEYEPSPKKKKKTKSLMISIDKAIISKQSISAGTNREKKKKSTPKLSSSSTNLTVSISRNKLSSHPASSTPPHMIRQPPFISPEHVSHDYHMTTTPDSTMKEKKKKKKKHKTHESLYNVHVQRYTSCIEKILEQANTNEYLSKSTLYQFLSETIKLKHSHLLHQVNPDLLIKTISVMDHHILDTAALSLLAIPDDAVNIKLWKEDMKGRVLRSLDASLVVLHITTAPRMPASVHLEESIDIVISHTNYHLEHNIYPEFDPIYREKIKDTGIVPRQKRRQNTSSSASKLIISVYHKMIEVIEELAMLIESHPLTDMTVLKLSSLGIFPFFVENISTLQLSALKIVRAIFARYEKHRDLIIEDIFASLSRLPTTKRNLRSFKLCNGENIQMVTALVLQLVQCIVRVPDLKAAQDSNDKENTGYDEADTVDSLMISSYDLSLKIGSTFLSKFMKKCCSGKQIEDFRPLFDNFVQDLLTTLNLPEWPASVVLLSLLGLLLVQAFSNRSNDQQLRLTSIDHLGVIAARLRKDAVTSTNEDHQKLIDVLSEIMEKKLDGISPLPSPTESEDRLDAFSENTHHFQIALIAYLTNKIESDPSIAYARDFYLGQWLRENQNELEKSLKSEGPPDLITLPETFPRGLDHDDHGDDRGDNDKSYGRVIQLAERNKQLLLKLVQPLAPSVISALSLTLDRKKSVLVTCYLTTSRSLTKNFDSYLIQLLRVLYESAVLVRTRAMKALSTIVAADPNILMKSDLQRAVQYRFTDSSTLMREAAVDLVGRFILTQPDLTQQYYNMLLERMQDTGVSVRKRVIKIFKDICVNQPNFDKIIEIYSKMLRRINDEEGIKQLVTSIFHQLWFSSTDNINTAVANITEVISKSSVEQEDFDLLLNELMKNEDIKGSMMPICQLMVDSLMDNVLSSDEASNGKNGCPGLVKSIKTLSLFAKMNPSFLTGHIKTLLPYLSSATRNENVVMIVNNIAEIFGRVIPLVDRPTESFITSLEEELVKLIMKQGPMIVQSCVSCLSSVINKVSHNYKLANECFEKFYGLLEKAQHIHKQDPNNSQLASAKPSILRSLFSVGLFSKYFDIDKITGDNKSAASMSQRVYSLLIFFCSNNDNEIMNKALIGFGFYCIRYPEMMLKEEAKSLYMLHLKNNASIKMKWQVIKNIQIHLTELESILNIADANRSTDDSFDNLLVLGDKQSSVSSNISQLYLPSLLESYYTTEIQIRLVTTSTLLLILKQGLVHPGQCLPTLIAMTTDAEPMIKSKGEGQLNEYCSRYGAMMQTHTSQGLKKAYQFQQLLSPSSIPRGLTDSTSTVDGTITQSSLLSHLYTLVRSSKPQRRALLQSIIRHFEDHGSTPLGMLVFLADNMAAFPYLVFDEPLFVIHNIDLTISVTGATVFQSFRDAFGKSGLAGTDDDDNEDEMERLSQETYNMTLLNECCVSSLSCVLLLILKQYLKQSFNLSDKKCQEYTPTENNKAWEKGVSRRQVGKYDPSTVVKEVEREMIGKRSELGKDECIKMYMNFKRLMNHLDPLEGDDGCYDDDVLMDTTNKRPNGKTPPPATPPPPVTKRQSRSRASSTSSGTSNKSKGKRGQRSTTPNRKSKKRKRQISSDEDDSSYSE
jgi:cohesin loading factor subunit SCC2